MKDNMLSIPKLKSSVTLKCVDEEEKIFLIGNYTYSINTKQIDLQDILTNPYYWLGNVELADFAGTGIYQWYRRTEAVKGIRFIKRDSAVKLRSKLKTGFMEIMAAKEFSIPGLHYATVMLQSESEEDNIAAVTYFSEILGDSKAAHYKLALETAFRPVIINNLNTRRKMFLAAFQTLRNDLFYNLLDLYTRTDHNFINNEIITEIDNLSRGDENLNEIESVLEKNISEVTELTNLSNTPVPSLFSLLVSYGVNHPLSFYHIRRFFLQHELYGKIKNIRDLALSSRLEIRKQFTLWLGVNRQVAIDPETGEEYRWDDVLIFDQSISASDQSILRKAIIEKQIIREAIFLFSGGTLIRLNDILPSGVWISKFTESDDRSVFRVTVQTRFQGGFDISIHLNRNIPPEMLAEELKWKVIAGTEINGEKLAARFGGVWDDYNIWTEEFINEETVERFIRREYKKKDDAAIEKLRNLWKFFVWNAAAAYVKFWKLSEMRMELTDTTPDGIVVSSHDYQTGCIITSFSKRRESRSTLDFIMNFFESFVKNTEEKYPKIKKASVWNAIFSGIIEAEGLDGGVQLINKFRHELEATDIREKDDIIKRIDSFLRQNIIASAGNHRFLSDLKRNQSF